jgi:hypothetical protein
VLLALGLGAAGDDMAVVLDRGGVVEGEPGAERDQVVEVLALIPKPRLTTSPRFPRSVMA